MRMETSENGKARFDILIPVMPLLKLMEQAKMQSAGS